MACSAAHRKLFLLNCHTVGSIVTGQQVAIIYWTFYEFGIFMKFNFFERLSNEWMIRHNLSIVSKSTLQRMCEKNICRFVIHFIWNLRAVLAQQQFWKRYVVLNTNKYGKVYFNHSFHFVVFKAYFFRMKYSWTRSVGVITSLSHREGRQFESGRVHSFFLPFYSHKMFHSWYSAIEPIKIN